VRSLRRPLVRAVAEAGEGVRIALGNLFGARLRSFLTTLGIVIGVMTVIAIVAIIQGLNRSFEAQISNLGANTLYVAKWKFFNTSDDWWEMRNRKSLGREELHAIEREATHATAVAPQASKRGSVAYGDREASSIQIIGTNARYLDTNGVPVGAGRFLSDVDVDLSRSSVVLGFEVASRLFPGFGPEEILGRRVKIDGVPFTVIGTIAKRGQMLGMNMDANVMLPYSTFLRDLGSKRSIVIAVAGEPGKLVALEDELVGILRRVRRVPPEKKDDFAVNRQDQILKLYGQLTGALYGVAIGVGLITLVVGGIGIMNIMLVSVTERTREIGLRMAIGAKSRDVLLQFLVEALVISAFGGSIGIALGFALSRGLTFWMEWPTTVPLNSVAVAFGFAAATGVFFGFYPARKAAALDPIEALRFE